MVQWQTVYSTWDIYGVWFLDGALLFFLYKSHCRWTCSYKQVIGCTCNLISVCLPCKSRIALFAESLVDGGSLFGLQALKVLKTSEFMPYVVFIAAPELDTLRAMHKAVVDAGITTKLLTVSLLRDLHPPGAKKSKRGEYGHGPVLIVNVYYFLLLCSLSVPPSPGHGSEEDGGWEREDPEGVQPLLWPHYREQQPGQGLWGAAGCCKPVVHRSTVGPGQLGLLSSEVQSGPGHSRGWTTPTSTGAAAKDVEPRSDHGWFG